jgi:tRNA 2-selenouridine synthase
VLEDEGHMIGANHLPECMRERMAQSPLAVVEDPFESALNGCGKSILTACTVILLMLTAKRKAGRRTANICITVCLPSAVAWGYSVLPSSPPCLMRRWLRSSDRQHRCPFWLVPLLKEYYDPMYRYQLGKKAEKIIFRGSWHDVAAWLAK